ncbi:hypothetical protein SLE2022_175660 [Rubroshorea leprosula]
MEEHGGSKDFIFRIPELFKMRNEQAYTPYEFSIGPCHFDETNMLLRTGQNFKESYFERLIQRFPKGEKKPQLEEAIEDVYGEARECYRRGDVYDDVSKENFKKMLLLDGCFIIDLLRTKDGFSKANYQAIYHDLLLLDNQIPWFVLELLFDRTKDYPECPKKSLVELATDFFSPALPLERRETKTSNILHLVDFVWRFWVGSQAMQGVTYIGLDPDYGTYIPSATRLEEAGVKFQKAESTHTLDVKFNEGVLKIPYLVITAWTETVFRNLIIFEQCRIGCTPCVTCYAVLLDCLVNTSDDVDLMCREGVLGNSINPEETANFFNSVRRNTLVDGFRYASLCKDVNIYCQRRWPRWQTFSIQNYFSRPWAIVSVVFPMIVLFFTIMQVFYYK